MTVGGKRLTQSDVLRLLREWIGGMKKEEIGLTKLAELQLFYSGCALTAVLTNQPLNFTHDEEGIRRAWKTGDLMARLALEKMDKKGEGGA